MSIYQQGIIKKICSIFLSLIFMLQLLNISVFAEQDNINNTAQQSAEKVNNQKTSYEEYLSKYTKQANTNINVIFNKILNSNNISTNETEILFNKGGSSATFEAIAEQEGLYNLELEYSAVVDLGKAMQLMIEINGECPYEEASRINLEQIWIDQLPESGVFKTSVDGNDILPDTKQLDEKNIVRLFDNEGYYSTPLMFYLNKGVNTLTIESSSEAFKLYNIAFVAPQKYITYDEYEKANKKNNNDDFIKIIQAEYPSKKSDSSLYAAADRSDPLIEPMSTQGNKRNIIGTNNWKRAGQYLEWEFSVPEDGCYKFGFKYRQNANRGLYNIRKLYIDGKVPFFEALNLKFDYCQGFEMMVPGDENGEYLFYLNKGQHTIRLEVSLGDTSEVLMSVDSARENLSDLVRRIMMVTSANPDLYRDYYLEDQIPTMVEEMNKIADLLDEQLAIYQKSTDQKSSNASTLKEASEKLREFADKTYLIPEKLSTISSIVSNLANWINNQREQLIELDYIVVASKDEKMPKTKASFFTKIVHEIKMTLYSYVKDYNLAESKDEEIEVWVSGGRDQRDILKELINSADFEFDVKLKLVTASITNAIMAGIGPDIALSLARTEPVNLGMRGALEPLDNYDGFEELKSQFSKDAYSPYTLEGKTYGIPVTEMFDVLFIRTDIFENLGLDIPNTWDEFFAINRILQQNKMETGLPTNFFATSLYQNGGSYFNKDATALNFNNDEAFSTFKNWVELYTKHSFSLFKSDYNRFRSGEMPMMISPYTTYNTIYAAAPEIRNDWAIYLIPGTKKSDGTIDRTNVADATGTVSVMLADSKNKENAWEFLKWWASGETQGAYGKRIEYIMGVAGRYTPANQVAFSKLAWSTSEYNTLMEQWKTVTQIPEVPGGYYVTRNMDNAFRSCTTRQVDIKETFTYWMEETNKEIARKRNQYIKN